MRGVLPTHPVSMANLFPDIYPTDWQPEYERFQERDIAKSGALQINSYDPVNQFRAKATWNTLTRAQYDQLEDHWWSYSASAFDIFDFFLHKHRGLYVATADGISTTYTLPARSVGSRLVKHNSATASVQPSLLVGTGGQGEDQLQYTSASRPAAGVVITLDCSDARRRYECNYGTAKFLGHHREADVWVVEAEFIQKVLA